MINLLVVLLLALFSSHVTISAFKTMQSFLMYILYSAYIIQERFSWPLTADITSGLQWDGIPTRALAALGTTGSSVGWTVISVVPVKIFYELYSPESSTFRGEGSGFISPIMTSSEADKNGIKTLGGTDIIEENFLIRSTVIYNRAVSHQLS